MGYTRVTITSVYIASVALTFQVDLVGQNQSSSISQLKSYVSSSDFSTFSNYTVLGNGRLGGSVDVSETGYRADTNGVTQ